MAYVQPTPKPDHGPRKTQSDNVRKSAMSLSRKSLTTTPNGEAEDYAPNWPTNFTKGLPHDVNGIADKDAFELFFEAINTPDRDFDVPMGPCNANKSHRPAGYVEGAGSAAVDTFYNADPAVRGWESPVSGHVYDLQGPDAGSVGMAPAPRLGSDELAAEMAENYAMVLVRDTPFEDMRQGDPKADDLIAALNEMDWFKPQIPVSDWPVGPINGHSKRRRAARFNAGDTTLTRQSMFRGSTKGCMDGPYISQFMLIGNPGRPVSELQQNSFEIQGYHTKRANQREVFQAGASTFVPSSISDGYIVYGAQRVDQRVQPQLASLDYLTDWSHWLDVQNGADTRGTDQFAPELRFVTTPRDLATYVHFDALYQAYLNATLLMLGFGTDTDSGLPEPNGKTKDVPEQTRTPFATFGGPHILTLVTESATRSLKAVRRQKYNHHLRARPEAIGAVYSLAQSTSAAALGAGAQAAAAQNISHLSAAKVGKNSSLLDLIAQHNGQQNNAQGHTASLAGGPNIDANNHLLAMAFPEGSPMHPAYGAGHATVAGSCVTTLKIFFEVFTTAEGWELKKFADLGSDDNGNSAISDIYAPNSTGLALDPVGSAQDVTILGELNKLAANISIGRNMGGVHFYSDYFDSLRMGERVAVGMMLEQMETYCEPMSCRLLSFDNDQLVLKTDGKPGQSKLFIEDSSGTLTQVGDDWWERHVS